MARLKERICGDAGSGSPPSWGDLTEGLEQWTEAPERALLLRIVEAGGRRVPISELARAYGIPPAPSLQHDFPGLSALAKARGMKVPVVSEGSDDKGWYWMSGEDARLFGQALEGFSSR